MANSERPFICNTVAGALAHNDRELEWFWRYYDSLTLPEKESLRNEVVALWKAATDHPLNLPRWCLVIAIAAMQERELREALPDVKLS